MEPQGHHIIAEFLSCRSDLNNKAYIERILSDSIRKSGLKMLSIHSHEYTPVGTTTVAVIAESHAVIHTYPETKHASVDIFTCSPSDEKPLKLLDSLVRSLKPRRTEIMQLKRGFSIEMSNNKRITGFSFKGLEIKYRIKKKLLSKKSRYQQIDVIENDIFGRMLFLDNDLQISEADADIYNEALTSSVQHGLGKIAILGGGDGGVLKEILNHTPEKCYLVEMDKEVIDASKKFLKKICGNAFESRSAEIIIEDAISFLEKNKGFDAIISDLTWPMSLPKKEKTKFFENLISAARKSLNPDGIMTMQCCPEMDRETFNIIKKILSKHFSATEFQTRFIPSYCVNWVFAAARK